MGRKRLRLQEFWGLHPANGKPQKKVCLLKETNTGQEWLSLSPPTILSWAGESVVSAWTLVDLEGAAATGCQPITHRAGASLLKGDQAPLIAAPLPTSSPRSYVSLHFNADKFIAILYSLSSLCFQELLFTLWSWEFSVFSPRCPKLLLFKFFTSN